MIYEGRAEGMNPYNSRFAVEDLEAHAWPKCWKGRTFSWGFPWAIASRRKCSNPWRSGRSSLPWPIPLPKSVTNKAKAARPDAIVATGRSDFPNQVNNVLGFPGIFRGALDVRARAINEEMKVAATHALAALAKEDVPDSVLRAYGLGRLQFGPEYINPKPFDPRVLIWVSAAVAEAAMRTGVAQVQIDLATYRDELARRLGRTYGVMQNLRHRAQAAPKRIVFSEGEHDKVLRASHQIIEERIAYPILLGRPAVIENRLKELGFEDMCPKVVDPAHSPQFEAYVQEFYRLRRRRGVTLSTAREQMLNPNYFGAMMVHMGDADGFVAGVSQNYPDTIRPALQIIKTRPDVHRVAAVFVIVTKKDVYFFADTHVNIDPTAEDLGGNCGAGRGSGARIRRRAARGHALLLQLRQQPPSAVRKDAAGGGVGAGKKSRSDGGWRNDGRHRAGAGNHGGRVSLLQTQGRRHRAGLPRSRGRQHRLQNDDAHRRRGITGAHPDGAIEIRPRAPARRHGGRNRQHGRHRRRRRAETQQQLQVVPRADAA